MQSTFRYDVHAGTAGDNFTDTGTLTFMWQGVPGVTRIIEMSVWDNPAFVRLAYDADLTWGDEIELDQDDPPIQIPHAARAVQIRNRNAGNNSRFQIIGFW
jgi:hypothetical protein